MKKIFTALFIVLFLAGAMVIFAETQQPAITKSYGAVSSTAYFKEFNKVFTGDWQKYGQTFTVLQEKYFKNIYTVLIIAIPLIFLLHFLVIGAFKFAHSGEKIPWYSLLGRVIHWIAAVTFVIMLLSGLAMIYGNLFGGGAFIRFLRYTHGLVAIIFAVDALILFVLWVKDAIPKIYDIKWFLVMGGYLSKSKKIIKADKFNAGQKVWFWLATIGGIVMAVTGYIMYFFAGTTDTLRISAMIHTFLGMALLAMFFVHIYMGAFAIKGSLKSMIYGYKDAEEAKVLHNAHYEKLKNEGYISE
ncbi:formate dehydrogenase subunit gamma [Flexistipes sp.]|uniref:formate dehydrogenase subunit gamma n=1 Tax=Flexistipes sp. TaxID=3088135 RepID=UPI002E1D8855|nr:formate dehydrogenase subunit gamma [Flexistipes sp.]